MSKSANRATSRFIAPKLRRNLLASACLLALTGAWSSGAMAQSVTSYNYVFGDLLVAFPNTTPQAQSAISFVDWINQAQVNTGNLTASVSGDFKGIVVTSGVTTTPGVTTFNSTTAGSTGNSASNFIDMSLLTNPAGNADGQGIISGQLKGAPLAGVTANSQVLGSNISILETATAPATLVLSNNTLAASTTLNRVDSEISGQVPFGYSSAQNGFANTTTTNGPGGSTSALTVSNLAVTNNQVAYNAGAQAGSSAVVDSSTVTLDLATTAGGVLSSPLTVTNNSLTSTFQGNSASGIISANAGGGAFTGAAVVNNSQTNYEDLGNPYGTTASVDSSRVVADLRFGAGQTNLTSSLVISDNTISATSTGNAAGARNAAGSILAGNAILLSGGTDVTGGGSTALSNLNNLGGDQQAFGLVDLLVNSAQNNRDTGFISEVTAGTVTTQADQLAGGSITSNTNKVTSGATGNLVGNLVSVDAGNFVASATAAGAQLNNGTVVSATNTGAAVTVGVGIAAATVTGTIATNQNGIAASAEGNVSANTVSVSANNLTSIIPFGVESAGQSVVSAEGLSFVQAGISANNLQTNLEGVGQTPGSIGATVDTATVAINVVRQSGVIGTLVPVTAANLSANNNSINGSAVSNSGASTVQVSGTIATLQAGVTNTQVNQVTVDSSVSESGVSITTGGVSANSALTVNENMVASAATGNSASNKASVSVTNLTVGPTIFINDPNTVSSSGSGGTVSTASAIGLASGQVNTNDVTASNTTAGAYAVIRAGDAVGLAGISGSNLTVNSNVGSTTVAGNEVSNQLGISASNVDTTANDASQIAGLANLQYNNTGVQSADVGRSNAAGVAIGVEFQRGLATSTVSVNDNGLQASVRGNTATNGMTIAGSTLGSDAPDNPTGLMTSNAGNVSVVAEFGLLNHQVDDATSRSATVSNGIVGVIATGVVPLITASPITVQGNQIIGDARNNNADNSATLSGFANLSTSAGLLNEQTSTTPVSSDVTSDVLISGAPTAVASSNLSVANNLTRSLAVGSIAANTLGVTGVTNLGGNADLAAGSAGSDLTFGVLTMNADYGVGNVQAQNNSVTADVVSGNRITLTGSAVTDGAASVTGNRVQATAQATSAANALVLTGNAGQPVTNINGITAAVASVQSTNGAVSASQATGPVVLVSFGVLATSSSGTPLVVSGNAVTVSAGQNEATNQMTLRATNLSGGTAGTNLTTYDAVFNNATVGTALSVLNFQGGVGNVTATALPGVIGTQVNTVTNGSLTVNDNSVTAKANTNQATNGLDMTAGAGIATSAAVANVQNTSTGDVVSADITGGTVGVSHTGAGADLVTTTATVQGNNLTSQAGGNTASSALNAVAGSSIANTSPNPTFAVLNYQGNPASQSATISGSSIGVPSNAGNSLTTVTTSVLTNQVVAMGYGNSASNTLGMSVLPSGLNQATAGITSGQVSTGSVLGSVASVTTGIAGGAVSGGSMVVSGNTSLASAGGNQVVNRLVGR